MIAKATLTFITVLLALQVTTSKGKNADFEAAKENFFTLLPFSEEHEEFVEIKGKNDYFALVEIPNEDKVTRKFELAYNDKAGNKPHLIDIGIFDMTSVDASAAQSDDFVNYYLTFRHGKKRDVNVAVTNYDFAEVFLHLGAFKELIARMVQSKPLEKDILYFKTMYDVKRQIIKLANASQYTFTEELDGNKVVLVLYSRGNVVAHVQMYIELDTKEQTHYIHITVGASTANHFIPDTQEDHYTARLPMFTQGKNEFDLKFTEINQVLKADLYINDLEEVTAQLKKYFQGRDQKMAIADAQSSNANVRNFRVTLDTQHADVKVSYRLPSEDDVGAFDIELTSQTGNERLTVRRMARDGFTSAAQDKFRNTLLTIFEQIREMFWRESLSQFGISEDKFTTTLPASKLFGLTSAKGEVVYKLNKDKLLEYKYEETKTKIAVRIFKNINGLDEYFKFEFLKSKYERKFVDKYVTFVMSKGAGVYEGNPAQLARRDSEVNFFNKKSPTKVFEERIELDDDESVIFHEEVDTNKINKE